MGRKSKFILGLEMKRNSAYGFKFFTDEEKKFIIEDYLSSGKTKREIWFKYTGYHKEHGALLRWMRQLGYNNSVPVKRFNFVSNSIQMKKKSKQGAANESSFDKLQLEKRIEELENQLRDSEMKAIAFSTMVDIAEKELNISIRKKCNIKPLKK